MKLKFLIVAAVISLTQIVKAAQSLSFNSELNKHQAYREQEIQSWVRANAIVHERGGWREYLKEAQKANIQRSKDKP